MPRERSRSASLRLIERTIPKGDNSMKPSQHFMIARAKYFLGVAAGALLVVITLPFEAKAYTDPGTGIFLLQVLLAGIASGLFFLRTMRQRIKMLFKRNRGSGAAEDSNRDDNQQND
jgi:hypothetical protein